MSKGRMNHGEITALLRQWSAGDPEAFERLTPVIYDELRRLAEGLLRREGQASLQQRTALVHELYLKLVDQERAQWRDREQFFGIAVKMMRRLIIDDARQRIAAKRGAGVAHVPVHDELDASVEPSFTVLAVHEALDRFSKLDPERSRVVELRYFGGFDLEEIADLLQVSRSTVKRHWAVARLWLQRELSDAAGPSDGANPRDPDGELR